MLTSLWPEIFSCCGSSSSLAGFLPVTKLKSIEVPESDFTFSPSGCGPCWESVPPNEVPPPCFPSGAWDSLFGLFFCVCLSFYIFLSHDGMMFSLCKYPGPGTRIPISRQTPTSMDVSEGGQGLAVWEAELSAFCIAHSPGSGHGGRARGRNWSGLCLWLCCVDLMGVR